MDAQPTIFQNVDELIRAIQELQPIRKQAEADFAKIFPQIKERLSLGVSQKAIREALSSKGFKLHAQKFKRLLEAEELRQNQGSGSDLKYSLTDQGGKR